MNNYTINFCEGYDIIHSWTGIASDENTALMDAICDLNILRWVDGKDKTIKITQTL